MKKLSFKKITFDDLMEYFLIQEKIDDTLFYKWFNFEYILDMEEETFLNNLILKYRRFINIFLEEELKIKFLAPILNRVDFFSENVKDWYGRKLEFKFENKIILSGVSDFMVAKGVETPQKPIFFIQEFKKNRTNDEPKTQLLAEMLVAINLNNSNIMRGAFIVGSIWNFVILKRFNYKYEAYISESFDSMKIEDLKRIYINLQMIKNLSLKS